MKNILENLELKLAQTRLENSDKLDIFEAEYKKEYSDFFDILFENDNLWFKRYISVNFQLNKLTDPEKNNNDILKKSIRNSILLLPINKEKKEILEKKIIQLTEVNYWKNNKLAEDFNVLKLSEKFLDNSDLHKNKNYPIIESLEKNWILDKSDLIKISLNFKESKNFITSISVLENSKKEIIISHYFELNNTKSEDRINNFENDFKSEIDNSKNIEIYPKVLDFIWKNYFKLRIKNKVESKKDRLRRMFKIAFLKLYRLKYSWLDITNILNKIDSYEDLDSMINLLLKFFEQLKENPILAKDYIISDEIDDIKEIWVESEENKEKILFNEEKIIKVTKIIELWDKKINWNNLDELLSNDVDLIWDNFIKRNISDGIKDIWRNGMLNDKVDENKEDNEDDIWEINIEDYYEDLKIELDNIEKKKIKLFLKWEYDLLDEVNDELLILHIKFEKVSKLLWISDENI